MAIDEANASRRVVEDLAVGSFAGSEDAGAWITRPVAESVTEAMERAPLGALYAITYASLASRLRAVTDPTGPLAELLCQSLVHDAINFRSLNRQFLTGGLAVPTIQPNSGAGAGEYHSKLWGPQKDERLPSPLPLEAESPLAYAVGQDAVSEQNKDLLIAKLFADLQHHLPCVLFNVTSKTYTPIGIGGSSVTKRFFRDGIVVSELGYKAMLSVEATLVTGDDNATSSLQAIVEACFGTLRDQIGSGSVVSGRSWQLTLPTQLSPSTITETDAPWSQGDKNGKLYTATVGLEQMMFECITRIGKPLALLVSENPVVSDGIASIGLASETSTTGDMQLRLGGPPQRLVLNGMPLTADLFVSQAKRVLEIRKPWGGSGFYEVIPRRVGEATLVMFDTKMTVPAQQPQTNAGRAEAPLVQRKVVVSAV
jgi:hypothetical protein